MNQLTNCFQFWVETLEYMVEREEQGIASNEGFYWEEIVEVKEI